jgi:transcriptional regulator with XRE-family HTH domain
MMGGIMNPIRDVRVRLFAITQQEMADIAGVRQPTVSRWERDLLQPNLDALSRIRREALRRGLRWNDRLFFEAMGRVGVAA